MTPAMRNTASESDTNDEMAGILWRYNVLTSLLDQLPMKNVKIIQQQKIFLSKG